MTELEHLARELAIALDMEEQVDEFYCDHAPLPCDCTKRVDRLIDQSRTVRRAVLEKARRMGLVPMR